MPGISAPALAVVGMSGRFPGAPDLRAFWHLLRDGGDAVRQVPDARWNWRDYDSELNAGEDTSYCQRGGFIEHVDRFDGRFFGILPREAQSMDPQQRLFLQCAWAALEDAGYAPAHLAQRRVGVFVGVGHADYPTLMRRDGVPSDAWRGTGIALTAIANRVSYCLDLHGPSESIDTACSSSLVALHRASQALRGGECDVAIVGGVNLLLGPELFIAFAKAGMLSHAGHCQTFSADADGYVRGEGVAALVLTSLDAARANGDYVYGEVLGSAQNHGGRAHSFTAPNPKAQSEVIQQAWAQAAYSPRQARLIETHGTGTPLGDPIEINALKKAVPAGDGAPIVLGALKSQIGHLEAAAGIASVIKSLLCLHHRQQVGNLHHRQLNPQINLDDSPFQLASGTAALAQNPGEPLLAGVSAFGFGGVNAHVVLRAAAAPELANADDQPCLILLSAKDDAGLRARARQLLDAFAETGAAGNAALRQAVLERLRDLLGLMPTSDTAPTRLAALNVDAGYFVGCLEQVLDALQLDVPIDAWRGAVSLEEVAQRLATEAQPQAPAEPRLDSFAALPAAHLANASLASIARTLQEGRDAMPKRLAFVADSRDQLFQRLRDFLDGHHHGLLCSVAGTAVAAPTGAGQLAQWAAHWASSKVPSPDWASVYGERPRPAKIPLPAYPWRLERVWYTPAFTAASRATPNAAQAWLATWENATALPGSVMALAGLIGQALRQNPVEALAWRDLRFGPPQELDSTETLRFTLAEPYWQVSQGEQVLLQVQRSEPAPMPAALQPQAGTTTLAAKALYASLAEQGLGYSAIGRALQDLRSTPNSLHASLAFGCQGVDDLPFWAALLASLCAAPAVLGQAPTPCLPFSIRQLALDPEALPGARHLGIVRHADEFAVSLSNADGRCVLRLEGLAMRAIARALSRVSA
ncbi:MULTISPECIES: beta-ketoacyl synthase N-terminal-like domain-containing protein [unclassified Pseudomonas]|uniref:beta-ketoacyl synthase N-terminal-like domain-containing protein n=1 Tax=unclassified Pseudomonas TaxID=196821 RepID=UPI0021C8C8FB|nr:MULTISPECIES: beta-ketoacyl synthase N-terminal-like domain-containing protein [unclassified Pseudomonas]MCU1733375.1 polyketide synthase dehydratase domain-containing protein [Pseudomonas sp. 20P_3.2_Bac4]MCU1743938.1 polyketide synthase dehydratase domain-containing protein [Pseudomonas sp. 20P_3.2_Bac5]